MAATNPLIEVQKYGQSIWYDNIHRGVLKSGELRRMVQDDGILGLTSNPTIFERAIAHSNDYDDALRRLVSEGKETAEIYEALAIEDIRMAADILRPVYDRTGGVDGYVSLEVSPTLAYDTKVTISEARRLKKAIDRPNLMIKVPATPEGIPAVEQLIGDGVNVNVTLIFSLDVYRQVMDAYISGLEKLASAGGNPGKTASVASFFVSRLDTETDKRLDALIKKAGSEKEAEKLRGLLGRAAIASAKLAYALFEEVFGGERFAALKAKGARVQRPLWASTSTKNPDYRDVLYVEELIGPDTVNTAPPGTIVAFKDHGVVRETIREGVDGARDVFKALAGVGIDMDDVTQTLLDAGVKSFADSFESLLGSIRARQESMK